MKRLISVILVAVLLISATLTVYGAVGTNHTLSQTAGLYELNNMGTYDVFKNYVDGYSLNVDKGMTVDMSYSGVMAVLENASKRIEIYKQDLAGVGKSGYINYSNKFLQNTSDHNVEFNGNQTIGGENIHLAAWSRAKLKRVSNDKNYYLSMDIIKGNYAYTIFIKANQPIGQLGGYKSLVESFRIFESTVAPYNRTSKPIDLETRGWNEETREFYAKYFGDSADLTWGIFEPITASFNFTELKYYESYFGYEFPIILNYSQFENTYKHPNLKQRLETAYSHGKALELTLQTTWQDNGNMVYDVLDGKYDEFIYDYATTIKEFGHPVLFRLGNEMNGDWCPYSSYNTSKDPMIYKEFYKYLYKIFEEVDTENVIWIWNPNGESFPNFKWNHALTYYPGDEYVDIVGMTAYNTGNYYVGEEWEEFTQLYGGLYNEYCDLYGQPLMITEFASANKGGDKNQWVTNMFNNIKRYPRIKVAIWWDGCDWAPNGEVARSYFIDETRELMDIFRKYLKTPWYKDIYA